MHFFRTYFFIWAFFRHIYTWVFFPKSYKMYTSIINDTYKESHQEGITLKLVIIYINIKIVNI